MAILILFYQASLIISANLWFLPVTTLLNHSLQRNLKTSLMDIVSITSWLKSDGQRKNGRNPNIISREWRLYGPYGLRGPGSFGLHRD